ncbi:MAG: TIGR04150 pseudo-rSAM protein [Bacteroidales bacterium]|nr:TIGR04150 pseudo-rSAM protein [Bacteroidales bacterium]
MEIKKKEIWFTLSKDVYISFNSPEKLLLYNTSNGKFLVVTNSKCIELINKVYEPSNLGVVDIETIELDSNILDFLDKATSSGIGLTTKKSVCPNKPINLLPILNLQNDIEKLKLNGKEHLMGHYIADYLTSLNIFITTDCKQNCEYCDSYFKQTLFCTKSTEQQYIKIETLQKIFSQSASTNVNKINILGGNIMLYPQWDMLIDLLKKQSFDFHLWINLVNITDYSFFTNIPFHKEILVNCPVDIERLKKIISFAETQNDVTFNFIIENENVYEGVVNLIDEYKHLKYKLIPFYNGSNIDFFKTNVFMEESDILSDLIEMRIIFRNQKLNANFFGQLTFLVDGQVRANMNTLPIGYFPDKSILELTYEELIQNTIWRKVRDGDTCTTCMYRFLCPPPGNLETVLDKQNLCHIKP